MKIIGITSFKNTNFNHSKATVKSNYLGNITFRAELKQDKFEPKYVPNGLFLNKEEGEVVAKKLASATSGFRAELGKEFNDRTVQTITAAVAKYAKAHNQKDILIAGDTRQATEKYQPMIAAQLSLLGFNPITPSFNLRYRNPYYDSYMPVSTPILSLATAKKGSPISILLTASHNNWSDGGYNFLKSDGAVADTPIVEEIAKNIKEITAKNQAGIDPEVKLENIFSRHSSFNPTEIYKDYLEESKLIDFDKIKKANIDISYDSLEGTGQYYFKEFLDNFGIKVNKELKTKVAGPNPTAKNLENLSETVRQSKSTLKVGLANDGDADRFGVVDENGKFVSPQDVILLVAYHMIKNKGHKSGTIIKNVATSSSLNRLADYFNNQDGYNIDVVQTPVGFKYLGNAMDKVAETDKPTIVAGEESGGLTIGGHIPEKDGYIANFSILELMAYEGKPVGQILTELKDKLCITGETTCINIGFDTQEQKDKMVDTLKPYFDGQKSYFGDNPKYTIDLEKNIQEDSKIREFKPNGDGVKIHFNTGSSILARKSGTENIVRLYVDAVSKEDFEYLSQNLSQMAENLGGKKK